MAHVRVAQDRGRRDVRGRVGRLEHGDVLDRSVWSTVAAEVEPSMNVSVMSVASLTTCSAVNTWPSGVTMTPLPRLPASAAGAADAVRTSAVVASRHGWR